MSGPSTAAGTEPREAIIRRLVGLFADSVGRGVLDMHAMIADGWPAFLEKFGNGGGRRPDLWPPEAGPPPSNAELREVWGILEQSHDAATRAVRAGLN